MATWAGIKIHQVLFVDSAAIGLPCDTITEIYYFSTWKIKDLPARWFSFSLPFNTYPARNCRPPFTFPPPFFSKKETKERWGRKRSYTFSFHLNQKFLPQIQSLVQYIFIVMSFSQKCTSKQQNMQHWTDISVSQLTDSATT